MWYCFTASSFPAATWNPWHLPSRAISARGIARFGSAAGMAQALAFCLRSQPFDSRSQSPLFDAAMPAIDLLPTRPREWAYSIGGMTEGITTRQARQLDVEGIAEWLAALSGSPL